MKAVTKIGILLAALFISILGFNWITCFSGCIDIAKFCQMENPPVPTDATLNYEITVRP